MKNKNYILAHEHSSYHRQEILGSKNCFCFYCCKKFKSKKIKEWIDKGDTAICPFCSVDAVIGDFSFFSFKKKFIKQMHNYWFSVKGYEHKEIWREDPSNPDSPSLHTTSDGCIAITVDGYIVIKTIREWHYLGVDKFR